MGRGKGDSREGISKLDRYGGSRMSNMTPQTNAPTGGAKARPAKSNKSAQGDPSPVMARSTKKSAGSNKTQNRTASRHKVTAKE